MDLFLYAAWYHHILCFYVIDESKNRSVSQTILSNFKTHQHDFVNKLLMGLKRQSPQNLAS